MAMKVCPGAGCGRIMAIRPGLCDRCLRERKANSALLPTGSTARWRRLRALKLNQAPLCEIEGCIRPARIVDHWLPRESGGTDDPSNLVSMCASHHKLKTLGEYLRLRNRSLERLGFA